MKNIKSISTFIIRIDGKPVSCYYNIENADEFYIDVDTSKELLKKSIEEVEEINVELIDNDIIYNKKAYTLDDFIEHLKPKPLKHLAKYAILAIEKHPLLLTGNMSDFIVEEEEPKKLSSFDKLIKKALNYNPNKK